MTWQILFVFAVALAALGLFAWNRIRIDQVALAVPVVLLVAGIITPEEAISGLGNPATVTVAAMLVLGLGLLKTGAVASIGHFVGRLPLGSPNARLLALCGAVAAISPFLNNTAVVAVFLPVFLTVAREGGVNASRYLMPLSFAAILGGTVTLIGTTTNLIVYGIARTHGLDELGMFSIAPLGLVYLGVGVAYLLTVGRWLIPDRPSEIDLSGKYQVRSFVTELGVGQDSRIAGRTVGELGWEEKTGVTLLGIQREGSARWAPWSGFQVMPGDLLYVQGGTDELIALAEKEGLATPAEAEEALDLTADEARFVEILVAPGSPFVGLTARQLRFRSRYGATLLALQRHGETVRERIASTRLEGGDLLLIHGPAPALAMLVDRPGLIPMGEVDPPVTDRPRAVFSVLILASVVLAAATGLAPILSAAITGAVLMVFSRCVRIEEVYRDLDWMVVFLLAGLIPLGAAMESSGAAEWLTGGVAGLLGPLPLWAVVGGFYLFTSLLTEVMSNNASAVILTPLAILTAETLGMSPYALLVAVMFGASASFMTPTGYQTNTMIYGPGGYRFTDYLKVGAPLNLILLVVASLLIPLFWG